MHTGWRTEQIDTAEGPLPVRVLRTDTPPNPPLALHMHGEGDGRAVAELLAEAGAIVVSAEYPASPFPGPLALLYAALTRLHAQRSRWAGRASRLFVAGEETGGNLAAGLALMARDKQAPPLAGQILISPLLDPGMATCSIAAAQAGMDDCKWADFWRRYLGRSGSEPHPYAAPVTSARLGGLAPALVLTAEDDPLHDESLHYAEKLRAKGTAVTCECLPAPTHWPDALSRTFNPSPAWRDTVCTRVAEFLAAHAGPARPRH